MLREDEGSDGTRCSTENERLSNIEMCIDIEIGMPAASPSESAIFEMRKIDMRNARSCKKRVNFCAINYLVILIVLIINHHYRWLSILYLLRLLFIHETSLYVYITRVIGL